MKRIHIHKITALMTLLCTAVMMHQGSPAVARIYQQVDREGNITYYNTPPWEGGKPITKNLSSRYDSLIEQVASEENVDPLLIKCIIKIESDFRADAVSEAGAMGLMQLMQETADCYKVSDPFDPGENVRAGVKHFRSLLSYFQNDIPLALAAYHAGLGRVKRRMAIPPIDSTIRYVNAIMRLYRGSSDYSDQVKRLYKKIDSDGDVIIYSR